MSRSRLGFGVAALLLVLGGVGRAQQLASDGFRASISLNGGGAAGLQTEDGAQVGMTLGQSSPAAASRDGDGFVVATGFWSTLGRAATAPCTGDCGGDGSVTVDEILRGVNIALGALPLSACLAFDASGDSVVTIDELVAAVSYALSGCPADLSKAR